MVAAGQERHHCETAEATGSTMNEQTRMSVSSFYLASIGHQYQLTGLIEHVTLFSEQSGSVCFR
jgi:hypothetical protein